MSFNTITYQSLKRRYANQSVTIVAVSKTKPISDIEEAYAAGVRDFGENYVQELVEKEALLPKDIRWHFIGHLQSNKVKYIAPFVHLIHGVDSEKLLIEIDKQAKKQNRIIDCLLQIHIATEETKFGLDESELSSLADKLNKSCAPLFQNIRIVGMMGMASFSEDKNLIKKEFETLKKSFDRYKEIHTHQFQLSILSMGMSSDADIAVECGSTMIRIGSALFGHRQ